MIKSILYKKLIAIRILIQVISKELLFLMEGSSCFNFLNSNIVVLLNIEYTSQ